MPVGRERQSHFVLAKRSARTRPTIMAIMFMARGARGLSPTNRRGGAVSSQSLGLHDLHGNVWEWTSSEHDEKVWGAELRAVSDRDSSGPRGVAGGSWLLGPSRLRSAARFERPTLLVQQRGISSCQDINNLTYLLFPFAGSRGRSPWSPQILNAHRRIRLLKVSVEDRQQIGGFQIVIGIHGCDLFEQRDAFLRFALPRIQIGFTLQTE